MYPALCPKHFNRFSGFYNMYKWKLYTYLQWNIGWAFQVVLVVKHLPANAGDIRDVSSIPGSGESSEGRRGNLPSILDWRIPWTEEPGGLQSMGSQRVRHDWATKPISQRTLVLLHRVSPNCGAPTCSHDKLRVPTLAKRGKLSTQALVKPVWVIIADVSLPKASYTAKSGWLERK